MTLQQIPAAVEKTTMLCETCRWTERPGFIRRPQKPLVPAPDSSPAANAAADFIPCPDCGGHAIAHCCEGLCEQPDADAPGQSSPGRR